MNPLSNTLNETGYGHQIKRSTAEIHTICYLLYMDYLTSLGGTPKTNESTGQNGGIFFTTHIQMEFGLTKCWTLTTGRGNVKAEGFKTQGNITDLNENDTYL